MTVTDLQPGSIVGIAGPVIDAEFPQENYQRSTRLSSLMLS